MEICYYWIDKFDVIEKQGYNFGSQLIFDYKDNVLTISENKLYIEGFFNLDNKNRIKNITAICGENGVGKSTFLRAFKELLKSGGLRSQRTGREVQSRKHILVIKSDDEYKVIFYRDLLKEIKYKSKETEAKYAAKINFFDYDDEQSIYKFNNLDDLLKILDEPPDDLRKKLDVKQILHNATSCVYFTHTFDNNFYGDSTSEVQNYYDISTKGIMNDIEANLKPLSSHARHQSNHMNFKDNRFNLGLLKEFYISETQKRIKLLEGEKSRSIIDSHGFVPKKVHLTLDYVIYRKDNIGYADVDKSRLLRVEKNNQELSKVERYILSYIEDINELKREKPLSNPLLFARQTYLRRIIDSYFNDVSNFLLPVTASIREGFLQKLYENIAETTLKDNNLLQLLDIFSDYTIKAIKELKSNDNGTTAFPDSYFNEDDFKILTRSYTDFVKFLDDNLFKRINGINTIDDQIEFITTRTDGTRDTRYKDISTIEISLDYKGIKLLKEIVIKYNSIYTTSNFLKIQWGNLSSGEDALLNIYSRFLNLKEMEQNKQIKLRDNIVILLDEIEHSLHPEWQRALIKNLIEFLPYVFSESNSIQIVLATNVPFLIADIPTKNIVYLEKKRTKAEKTNKNVKEEGEVEVSDKPEQTFAANIHSLLINNFFMKSTLGKFSEKKIRDIIKILKEDPKKNKETRVESQEEDEKYYSPEEISTTIQTIGEPLIKNKLESMYFKKYDKDKKETEITRLISEFQDSEKDIPDKINTLLNEILRKARK